MCGIAGELGFNGLSSGADWRIISSLMARRGPDDAGDWSDGRGCTMVFRRLSIIDLSPNGHQPMLSRDGRYVIVFNGELYNYREIRSELASAGITFRSSGDTEVVLSALMAWGKDALRRFNGMFALAFYDTAEKRLLLARDHAGIKPLYYMQGPQGIVFSSQYDQLLAHPWVKGREVSMEALGLYLRLSYIPAPYAILKSTYMLEPGAWLEISVDGRTAHGKYFEFPKHAAPTLTGVDAYDAVDKAVTNAVRRQLVSDVPVGAFLSGGIDSPLVVAKMAEEIGADRIQAFTIGTGGDKTDESEDAKIYARELGVGHVLEMVTANQALDLLDDVVNACGEPFGDFSIFPTMLVSRLASHDYKVMLSGDGGDELFWGYTTRASRLLQLANNFSQPHWMRKLRWGLKKFAGIGGGRHDLRYYSNLGEWQKAIHTHPPERLLSRIFPRLPAWPAEYKMFDYTGYDPDETAQWLRWNEFVSHLTMVLMKVDRASMYQSLEVRVPLLDMELIQVAMQVCWDSCVDFVSGTGKIPLRQALARHVRYQTTEKRGFAVPMDKWLRTSLRQVFEELVLKRDNILGMEVDKNEIRSIYNSHINGINDYSRGLWTILSLALWERRYFH